jgi:hypothetical protein
MPQLEERLRSALAPALQVIRPVGAGGMAQVFLAREPALRRLVAVKVMSGEHSTSAEARARFEREAQAVASLSHPNIVNVHSVGELDDGTPYFVMQFVEGRSFAERVRDEGPLSVAEARRVLGEVAGALATAHAHGIIHRDIKPANILHEESTGRALVSDFGIAAFGAITPTTGPASDVTAPIDMQLTAKGVIVGTPQYMSPEQLLREKVTDKTDVFSLGLVAHRLLVRSPPPFEGATPYELMAAYGADTARRLTETRPDVDHELDELVARCLDRDADKRPTAAELAKRLAPGGASLLEWPAPGLESLQGGLKRVSVPWLYCSGIVTIVMVAFVRAGPALNPPMASFGAMVLMLAMIFNLAFLITAVRRTLRVGVRATRAVRRGYAWLTVLETLCDSRGDTGNLIAGTREYSGLTPAQRDFHRRNRIWKNLDLLAAGTLALPLLVVCLALAAQTGVQAFLWVEPFTVLALIADWLFRTRRDVAAFRSKRHRRSAADEVDLARLVTPWNENFDYTRAGQQIGRGVASRPTAGVVTAVAVSAVIVVAAVLLAPFVLVATVGPLLWLAPSYGSTDARLRVANVTRANTLPRDSSISPVEAGNALRALIAASGSAPQQQLFAENPDPISVPAAPWSDSLPPGLFPRARDGRRYAGLPSAEVIIGLAASKFTAAEMAYLERIAHAPHWRLYDLVARAPRMDYYGAWLKVPLPDSVVAYDLPIPPSGPLRSYADASVSRAAYYMARGRRDSAEHALRLTVSAGHSLIDNAVTLVQELSGIAMVDYGRQGLLDIWEPANDPRGVILREQLSSALAENEDRQNTVRAITDARYRANVVNIRAEAVRAASDSTASMAHRFDALNRVAIAPCTNVRELLFGYDADIKGAFDAVRRDVKSKVDSAIVDMQYTAVERFRHLVTTARGGRGLYTATALAGAAMLNKRFAGCTSLLLSRTD